MNWHHAHSQQHQMSAAILDYIARSQYHRQLLNQCGEWISQGQYTTAVVFSETAYEIFFMQILEELWSKKGTPLLAVEDIVGDKPNIMESRLLVIYKKLTSDDLMSPHFRKDMAKQRKIRNDLVHGKRKSPATQAEAEEALDFAEKLTRHLADIYEKL